MITLPLHPHCMCRYDPYYLPVTKRHVAHPEKETMAQFREDDQRRILGSRDAWRRWREGTSAETLWNGARPAYPIRRYGEVLGYNERMKTLTKQNITKREREAISRWTDYKTSRHVRKYFYGLSVENKFAQMAIILKSMFKKYDSGLDKGEPIYRGLRFKDKKGIQPLLDSFSGAMATQNPTKIDQAPSSFSRKKRVAYEEFALAHKEDVYSLVFKLTKRKDGELFIKDFAGKFAYQEEIIIKSHESEYRVVDIQEPKEYNKTYEIIIEEL